MVIRIVYQLEASEPVDMQRPMWSSSPFPEMSVSFGRDRKKSLNFVIVTQGSGSMRTHLMLIHTFCQLEASEPIDTQRPMSSYAPFPDVSIFRPRLRKSLVCYPSDSRVW
ncbi:hypothetical protein AAZX31_04G124900 [Glycine max]